MSWNTVKIPLRPCDLLQGTSLLICVHGSKLMRLIYWPVPVEIASMVMQSLVKCFQDL